MPESQVVTPADRLACTISRDLQGSSFRVEASNALKFSLSNFAQNVAPQGFNWNHTAFVMTRPKFADEY